MTAAGSGTSDDLARLAVLGQRLAAACTLEDVIDAALAGVDELLGHPNSLLLVAEPDGDRLVTLASRGYETGGVGSEVRLDEGVIGMVGARRHPMRIGNLQRMLTYARAAQASDRGPDAAPYDIRLPGLEDARSQLAAPMVARDTLVGVLAVESSRALAYDGRDEQLLTVAAHLVAAALEREQVAGAEPEPPAEPGRPTDVTRASGVDPDRDPDADSDPAADHGSGATSGDESAAPVVLRHYAVDGSTFLDDGYVIKGVAGRLLWKLAAEHDSTGRTSFTNREAKLDPVLELPAFRDNFESRLILLKRRLDERDAPLRITSAGRGRFDLEVRAPLTLVHVARA